jgi:hypothetical protein
MTPPNACDTCRLCPEREEDLCARAVDHAVSDLVLSWLHDPRDEDCPGHQPRIDPPSHSQPRSTP